MSKGNNNNNKVRKLVGYKLIPMQADQVDMIAKAEGSDHPTVRDTRLRCRLCWLKGATTPTPGKKGDHFCRWNIENQGPRNPDPKPYRQPIYRWVDKK